MKAEREKLNAKTVAAQLRLTNGEYRLQEGEDICRILLVSGGSCTLQRGEESVLVNPGCVLLLGPGGGALLALVSRQTHFSLISRVLKRIESQYTENLSVDQLAAEANMSVSAFHHNFKSVTSTSPLQYLKTYRLHKARMLMIHDGMKASAAAMRVGYESASQFSREFKRYFGVTPGEDASRIRTMQGV